MGDGGGILELEIFVSAHLIPQFLVPAYHLGMSLLYTHRTTNKHDALQCNPCVMFFSPFQFPLCYKRKNLVKVIYRDSSLSIFGLSHNELHFTPLMFTICVAAWGNLSNDGLWAFSSIYHSENYILP